MGNLVAEKIQTFSHAYGRELTHQGQRWRYYRLGAGPALFWITGGLRRAAFGFGFMECLARRLTVIAPDLAPVRTFTEMAQGFEAILAQEQITAFHLGGQSYGSILAQGFLARHLASRPEAVGQLILSSGGPADYGRGLAVVEDIVVFLARWLPERQVKNLLASGLKKVFSVPDAERADWMQALDDTMHHDLTRQDVISHFAVVGDLFRQEIVRPAAYRAWQGRPVILRAENDPTQGKGDLPRFEKLFERPLEVIDLEQMGHTAALRQPEAYADLVLRALG